MGTAGQSITLANSIIGVGILAMPFCFQQCGVLLATLILLLMGLVSRLCCYFLLKSALIARRRNFEFLAFHVFGPAGKLAVELGIIGFLMGTCIAYFVVVGELGPQIIAKMFNINQSDMLRTSIMVIVSLVCVLPLGLLRNVDSLSNVSAATIGFYFCLVTKVILEAASQLLTGEWQTRMEMWKSSGVLQCVPIFSMALFCQTQLFEIFESLPLLSLEKMNVVTKNAINICTGVYLTLGVFGYVAFCKQEISGNVLMSLSPTMANDVIKLGFVMSLAFSFPLIIFPCRASIYSFLYRKVHPSHHDHIINHSIPETTFRCITIAIVAVTLFISLLIPNIELVLGLVGSTIGVMICIVFPAACFVNLTFKDTNERLLAKVILILGFFVMVLGTYANLQAAEYKIERYDERYLNQERIDKIVEDFFQSKKLDIPEDAVIKPIANDAVPKNGAKTSKEVIKDSEVQPPNPVPPESQSNERKSFPEVKENPKLKEAEKKITDKLLETHPKNLSKFTENKISKEINDAKKTNVKNPKTDHVVAPEQDTDKQQEKIDRMKQQQLMETIKQHGEEQKELIKEQKQILHEFLKTKEEMQQNKNTDEIEAKKIAVESIQKIANMAIQSLSGVSEKPVGQTNNDKKAEPLKKIANEAVQEIAKQAVETIKEIERKKEIQIVSQTGNNMALNGDLVNPQSNKEALVNNPLPANVPNSASNNNVHMNYQNINTQQNQNTGNLNNIPQNQHVDANTNQLNANVQPVVNPSNTNQVLNAVPNAPIISNQENNVLNHQPNNGVEVKINNEQPNVNEEQNSVKNVANQASLDNSNKPVNNVLANNIALNQADNNVNQQVISNVLSFNQNVNEVKDSNNQLLQKDKQNIEQEIQNNMNVNIEKLKGHQHSPDEPQSYKQGEDTQKNIESNLLNKNLNQNIPLPIMVNGDAKIKQNLDINNQVEAVQKPHDTIAQIANIVNSNIAKDMLANNVQENNLNNNPVRQKREVVDCTEKTSLKPEDKEICDNLVDNPKFQKVQEFLPKVDFNDVALPKSLSLDSNLIHHIRSLKNYEGIDKER